MSQVFNRRANTIARLSIFVGVPVVLILLSAVWWYYTRSDWVRDVGPAHAVVQPGGGFSHQLHVGGLKMDCRYCHNSVEISSSANIPSTETCMSCHSQVLHESPKLEFVRSSYVNDEPIQWNKVHDLPKFVYFNHSIHVAKGVGCSSCHGNIATMPVVYKTQALYMSWCLDCHRAPEQFLRPQSEIFNTAWTPPADQIEKGLKLKEEYGIRDSLQLTNCSICHR
jgi:hypothetical protein